MRIKGAVLAAILPLAAQAEKPLSAIEWLDQSNPTVRSGPVLLEPPVTETALQDKIEVRPLQSRADAIGLVPATVTGLPQELWRGSTVEDLVELIRSVPVNRSPAMQTLLYTLLLSETRPPEGAENGQDLLLARLDRLMDLGATDPVQTLAEVAGPQSSPDIFRRWFDATLLNGDEDTSCAVLANAPHLLPDYEARIFCGARRGDWQTAALTLEAAHALNVLPQERLSLLDRFLSPDIFEGAPPLPLPSEPDPLTFRLFETIGERLPTASLPRAFANADLRDVAGWKAQVEAAERLTRIGALPPNRLLGLYSDRKPAASGSIWDRITALQRFETALTQNSVSAVEKTLPTVWNAMQTAQLEVPFAALFANQLATLQLDDAQARAIVWQVQLLSPDYELAAKTPLGQGKRDQFLAALALGVPGTVAAPSVRAQAIADGFSTETPLPKRVEVALADGQLGKAILLAMIYFDRGARGNPTEISGALATFRKLGLEDITRRAALQLMLLDRPQ